MTFKRFRQLEYIFNAFHLVLKLRKQAWRWWHRPKHMAMLNIINRCLWM